jgi:hypothetical protein
MKFVGLSALSIGLLYPQETHLVLLHVTGWVDHSAAESIKSMKILDDPCWERTRDLPAPSAVRQPTPPPRTIYSKHKYSKYTQILLTASFLTYLPENTK